MLYGLVAIGLGRRGPKGKAGSGSPGDDRCTMEWNPGTIQKDTFGIDISLISTVVFMSYSQSVCLTLTILHTVCCPDPNHVDVPLNEYRQYANLCEWDKGSDSDGEHEDAIACGYGTCPLS